MLAAVTDTGDSASVSAKSCSELIVIDGSVKILTSRVDISDGCKNRIDSSSRKYSDDDLGISYPLSLHT